MIVQGKGDNYHVLGSLLGMAQGRFLPSSWHITLGGTANSEPFVHLVLVQDLLYKYMKHHLNVYKTLSISPIYCFIETNGQYAWDIALYHSLII